jgi:hypothetical protein
MLRHIAGIVWLLFLAVFILDSVLVNSESNTHLFSKYGELTFLGVWGCTTFWWMILSPPSRPAVVAR